MAGSVTIADSFEWAGGTGRFGTAGVLDNANAQYVLPYPGVFLFTIRLAFRWTGAPCEILNLKSAYYQRYNPAWDAWNEGGRQGPEPPKCLPDLYQEDMGWLWVDFRGGLRYYVSNKIGNWEAPVTFTLKSSWQQFLVPLAWNTIELRVNLGRLSSHGTRLCGSPDPFGNAIGIMVAKINDVECMRTDSGVLAASNTQIAFCGCLNSKNDIDIGAGFVNLTGAGGNSGNLIDDFAITVWGADAEVAGEPPAVADSRAIVIPVAAAGSSAQWTPVGAPTNWQAALANDASAYNRTNATAKRDSLALRVSADTSPVMSALPVIFGRTQYARGAPAVKALYRRDGLDYLTPELALPTAFAMAGDDAGIPISGETVASLSAGEVGYTTE